MNAKNILYLLLYVVISYVCILTSCKTTGNAGEISREHTARINELENRVIDYERRIEQASIDVGIIRERASKIEDGIDRIAYLFGEYDRIVRELLRESYYSRSTQQNDVEVVDNRVVNTDTVILDKNSDQNNEDISEN